MPQQDPIHEEVLDVLHRCHVLLPVRFPLTAGLFLLIAHVFLFILLKGFRSALPFMGVASREIYQKSYSKSIKITYG